MRKPKDYVVKEPGDLLQLDTLEVRLLPGESLKQFTARDVISRWDVLKAYRRATAASASAFLDVLEERLPFRSPKLNGRVERAQRTHTEEFYEVNELSVKLEGLNRKLQRWETVYKTIRPHQALGYFTPEEFLRRWRSEKRGDT